MATYPLERAQDAAYQSYTSRLNELLSLPKPAQGLNTTTTTTTTATTTTTTNNNNNINL
jgi:hypothetical protein